MRTEIREHKGHNQEVERMMFVAYSKMLKIIALMFTICFLCLPTYAKYSGGTGVPDDPYQIATAEDLMLLGESPEDYEKHFILTDDIDLDPNLPGRKVFDEAIIGYFKGVFDGNGHTISNFNCKSSSGLYIGFFRHISGQSSEIKDLGLIAPDIEAGAGRHVGSLVGLVSSGTITNCYTEGGSVTGEDYVGGQVGYNHGNLNDCYSTCAVTGNNDIGGLVGENGSSGVIRNCYSTGKTTGSENVGGLVGQDHGSITASYSYADVEGQIASGGLVGRCVAPSEIINCYAHGNVVSEWYLGGLVGSNGSGGNRTGGGTISNCYSSSTSFKGSQKGGLLGANWGGEVNNCFWDVEVSGLTISNGGEGKTTAEMQTAITFLEARWDFLDETENGTEDIWWIDEGQDYPRLWWETLYVDDDAPDDPGPGDSQISDPLEDGRQAHPFDSIQEAIDFAPDYLTILVRGGIYREPIDFKGKAITVMSGPEIAVLEAPGDYAVSFYSGEGPDSVLQNFVIRNSLAGVYVSGSSPTIRNLTVVDNEYGIIAYTWAQPDISNCIFWNNSEADLFQCEARYSCIEDGDPGEGNLSADPLFIDADDGDYHLLSAGWCWSTKTESWTYDYITSPCIDAGDPDSPLGDELLRVPRDPDNEYGVNLRINMGAYGGTAQASMAPLGWLDTLE